MPILQSQNAKHAKMTYRMNQPSIKVVASSVVEDLECVEVEFLHHIRLTDGTEENMNEVSLPTSEVDGSSRDEHGSSKGKDDCTLKTEPRSYSTDEGEDSFNEKSETTFDKVSSLLSPSTDSTITREVGADERISRPDQMTIRIAIADSIAQDRKSCDLIETMTKPPEKPEEYGTILTANETTDLHQARKTVVERKEFPLSDGMISSVLCNENLKENEGDCHQEEDVADGKKSTPVRKAISEPTSPETQIPRSFDAGIRQPVQVQSRIDTSFVNAMFDYMNIESSRSQDGSIIDELDCDSSAGELSEDFVGNSNLTEKWLKAKMTKDMFDYILHDDVSLVDLNSPSYDEIDTTYYAC